VTSRRLLALLCAALLGVLVVLGLAVTALLGPVAGAVYAVVALGVVAFGAVRGRRLLAPPARPAGRTCDCCTTTHFDPVEVV
jgi:hypothetical protein